MNRRGQMINISLTEEMVLNPSALPEQLRDWRMYRIEYGGPNEDCIWEGRIMLPASCSPECLEQIFERIVYTHTEG
jgi:hypothetical protein